MALLGAYDLVEFEQIKGFTLSCQPSSYSIHATSTSYSHSTAETGGFSKWPEYYPDVLHTYMSLAGMSLGNDPNVEKVDPALGFSKRIVDLL